MTYLPVRPESAVHEDGNPNIARQGDILLMKVDSLPEGVEKKLSGRVRLALGEVTGHDHVVKQGDLYWPVALGHDAYQNWLNGQTGMPVFVVVPEEGSELIHQDHWGEKLDPGVWRAVRQREHDPELQSRYVAD